jgi:iron complex outermembrane receptor protein
MIDTRKMRSTLLSLACAAAFVAPAGADSPATSAKRAIDVPAGELTAALELLASQSGVEFVYAMEQIKGLRTRGVHGEFSAETAVMKLLEGTRLVLTTHASGAMLIAAPAPISSAVATGALLRLAQASDVSVAGVGEGDRLEEVVVTGSNIRSSAEADKSALPVQVLTDTKFKMTAGESIGDLLRSQPVVAGFNTTPANDEYAGGNTTVNLRGIGDQYTLVLVNGRRFGGEDVPDIGAIPTEAIDSVEILKNGASAVFGSDAVAGVVNVKLKDDFEGLSLVSSYGNTTNHDASFRRVSALGGKSYGQLRLVGSLSWQDRNGVFKEDRDISASRDFRPYGGIDRRSTFALIPNQIFLQDGSALSIDVGHFGPGQTGATAVDYVTPVEGQKWSGNEIGMFPPYRRLSGHWLAEYDLFDDGRARLFAEGYFDRRNQRFTYVAAQTYVVVPAANPYNPFGEDVEAYYQFGPDEMPLLYSDYETRNFQNSLGVRGDLGDYRYEVAYTRYRKNVDSLNYNDVSYAAAQAAVERTDATALNVFGYWANSPAQLAGLTVVSGLHTGNDIETLEGRLSGPLFSIPTGAVEFAAGAAHREVDFSYVPDETWRTVETYWSGLNTEVTGGDREVDSAYAEVRVPLLRSSSGTVNGLEVGAATRYEKYSDFGSATVGQFSARLAMLEEALILRSSFAEAFKAPSVSHLTAPATSSTLQGLVDPCVGGVSPCVSGVAPVVVIDGGNPDLEPESAETWDIGIVYSPAGSGLSLKADYWKLDLTDLIDIPDVQSVLFGTSPNGSMTRDPGTGTATVDARLDNGGNRSMRGLDIGAAYAWQTETAGRIAVELNATRLLEFKTIFGAFETDHLEDGGFGVVPKWRSVLGTYWDKAGWEAAFFLHFSEGVPDSFGDLPPRRTEDYWTGDIQVAYRFGEDFNALGGTLRNTRVHLGVENFWDTDIPFMLSFSDGFDRSIVDYRGRYVYFGIEKGF